LSRVPAAPPAGIVAVVFDLDGTLVDSFADIASATYAGLAMVDAPPRSAAEVRALVGAPLDTIFRTLASDDPEVIRRAADAYRAHYFEHCVDNSRLFPGVVEGLAALRPRRLAIATTKKTVQARRVASLIGLAGLIDHVQGSDGIPHKPDPTVVRQALAGLDAPAARAIMVGDTLMDIGAGKAAGCAATVGVSYGVATREELLAAGADLVIDRLDELVSWLD